MRYETISDDLRTVIQATFASQKFDGFRLGGDTALAIQLGHHISVDADFISADAFDKDETLQKVMQVFPNSTDIHQGTFGLFLRSGGIKIDFLSWKLPFIRPANISDGWPLLDLADIAAMKLFAILQRGEKKDYLDIAALLQIYSLPELISFYNERHPNSDSSVVLRFLLSYADLDNQPMPLMLNGMTWSGAKSIIEQCVKDVLKK